MFVFFCMSPHNSQFIIKKDSSSLNPNICIDILFFISILVLELGLSTQQCTFPFLFIFLGVLYLSVRLQMGEKREKQFLLLLE